MGRLIQDEKIEIIYIPDGIDRVIKHCTILKPCIYVPWGFKSDDPSKSPSLMTYDLDRLTFASKAFQSWITGTTIRKDLRPGRKVFLSRPGKFRNAINKSELEGFFSKAGFEVVDPSLLSLDEQLELYSNTTNLASTSGAALSNMYFMPRNSQVTVVMARSMFVNYGYWGVQAKSCGHSLNLILYNPLEGDEKSVHPSYIANEVEFRKQSQYF